MSSVVWLHEDALRADHPAVIRAGADAHLCYVWDKHYLTKMDYGFKRLLFIYETLSELPVTIYQGDTVTVLEDVMTQKKADCLYIPATPNPGLQTIGAELTARFNAEIIEDVPFVHLNKEPDIKRFFRYWNKAKKHAMQIGGGHE